MFIVLTPGPPELAWLVFAVLALTWCLHQRNVGDREVDEEWGAETVPLAA